MMGRIGLAFLTGVCLIHAASALPDVRWAAALGVALAAAASLRAGAPFALLAGVAWAWGSAALRLSDDLSPALEGQDIDVAGYVASLTEVQQSNAQFLLDVTAAPEGAPARILLTWYRATDAPQPGEQWRFTVRLKRRSGFANPGGFDYERHLFHEGVGATGYVRGDAERMRPPGLRYGVVQVRGWIARRLEQAAGGRPMLGIVQGLAIGDTRSMTAEQWRVFAATGTTHLMAISGLHVTMAAALAAALGGALIRRWPRAQQRGWAVLHGQVIGGGLGAFAYSALAGLSIPTQRTLIMLSVYFVARWRRRELTPTHALGLALVAVLINDPFAPLAPGAWLSFGAVALILLALTGRLRREGSVRTFGRVQLALSLGLTPLLLGAFGGVSVIAPVANVIAVPLFTLFIVPSVLLGALTACASIDAAAIVLLAPLQALEWFWPTFVWLAEQPLAFWRFPEPTLGAFAALTLGSAMLAAPGPWFTRCAGLLLCLPVIVNRPISPPPGEFKIAVLDVGQGLASVVFTHSHVLVYDAGPAFQSGRDAGELVLVPYLHHRAVRRIDALLISHGDLDHRGGTDALRATLPVETLMTGPSVRAPGADRCTRGRRWIWDGVAFEVLHPSTEHATEENDSSCVLLIRSGNRSALFTGDIEATAEERLVSAGLSAVDLVVAPHHGSRTSSTPAFVAALKPQLAVFSTGYRNRWGFPKADVVARWREVGARTYDTASSGALEITFGAERPLRVREHRRSERGYWNR